MEQKDNFELTKYQVENLQGDIITIISEIQDYESELIDIRENLTEIQPRMFRPFKLWQFKKELEKIDRDYTEKTREMSHLRKSQFKLHELNNWNRIDTKVTDKHSLVKLNNVQAYNNTIKRVISQNDNIGVELSNKWRDFYINVSLLITFIAIIISILSIFISLYFGFL